MIEISMAHLIGGFATLATLLATAIVAVVKRPTYSEVEKIAEKTISAKLDVLRIEMAQIKEDLGEIKKDIKRLTRRNGNERTDI